MSDLYPLKFNPIFKDKIWGGNKINTILNKEFKELPNCGESWEISAYAEDISIVSQGHLAGRKLDNLIKEFKGRLVGESVYNKFGNKFPLLVKFIDANADLSIQVHPSDEVALKRHNSFGKTEMWYIVQADDGAELSSGFNGPLTKEQYLENFNNGLLMDILNIEKVKANDVFFLPAGRVHHIGKGCLLTEIQQTSDLTYRIYDFDRTDDKGNKRELHTEESLEAIDFTYHEQVKSLYEDKINEIVNLVSCEYFTTNKLHFNQPVDIDHSNLDSFVIYVCMEGGLKLEYAHGAVEITKGETLLLPASINNITITPQGEFKMLESYIAQGEY
ncbi:MAG: class I mannose-6-phosphate isomerase [Cyclobacteriaceae bacterium]|nr:class I mannose-6-phosphate isomerase [Cyclobacteriaceae bacterium]